MQFGIGLGLVIAPLILAVIFILNAPLDYVFWPKWLQKLFHPATLVLGVAAFAAGLTLLITSC